MLLPPAEPDAKEYSVGWMARARTDFLWCVSVTEVFPAARSHNLKKTPYQSLRMDGPGAADIPDSRVHTASDDLWVGLLAFNISDRRSMARKNVDLRLRPHVPYSC